VAFTSNALKDTFTLDMKRSITAPADPVGKKKYRD
jgi:hypothetical protein